MGEGPNPRSGVQIRGGSKSAVTPAASLVPEPPLKVYFNCLKTMLVTLTTGKILYSLYMGLSLLGIRAMSCTKQRISLSELNKNHGHATVCFNINPVVHYLIVFVRLIISFPAHSQIYRSVPTGNAIFPRKLALLPILTKFGQWDDLIISQLQAIFQVFPLCASLGRALRSYKLVSKSSHIAVAVVKMFICSRIVARYFGNGRQDIG